jgi:CHAT domain-containing protein/tetratricopeptide (TPR) repeat protein
MAAFVDGTLPRGDVAAVAEHLRGCSECRTVVSETAQFTDEEETHTPRAWWMVAAAVLAVVVVAAVAIVQLTRSRSPIDRLIASAPHEHRPVEARLSGFAWARLQTPSRGEAKPDPADLKFAGAAGEALESKDPHAKGVADLVIGRRSDSVTTLEHAANDSKDPRVWSDLAAARYAFAVEDEHPSQLPEALADTDHALRLDPRFTPALFNRALILEHLGILEAARKAWAAYLAVDPTSDWSIEARAHLHKISGTSRRFEKNLIDTAPADQLVREFPEEARRYGEAVLLPDHLARARAIADALAAYNGERLLQDAVGAVERAEGSSRQALADAYREYRDARISYSSRNAGIAEAHLRHAADLFRQGGSPMAEVARYYAASAAFDQNCPEARGELQHLLGAIDSTRYRALAAQIEWELAVAANAEGDWGEAARLADHSAAALHSLGERHNAAYVEGVGAIAYEMIGARDLAWTRRASAYAELSRVESFAQLNTMLQTATITLVPLDRIAAASALVDLTIGDTRSDAVIQTASLATRARLAMRLNDNEAARRTISEARLAAARISDKAVREPYAALVDIAEAEIDSHDSGKNAVAAADRALSLLGAGHLEYLLPDAYLQRGRAHRALGDRPAALADYGAALREIERQDAAIHDPERRLDFLDTAARVTGEIVDLRLSIGDVSGAFAAVDSLRSPGVQGSPSVPNDVAVVEYLVRPNSLTVFCVSREGLSEDTVAIDRGELATNIESFADHIRRRAPLAEVRREGAALYRLLFQPVKRRVGGVREIVIIPDERLYSIPFAALWDSEQHEYLIEQYVIRFATAARHVATPDSTAITPALVISDPPAMHEPRLLASREEASRIATLRGAVLVAGEMATKARFLELAPASALIHFAGHANSDATQSYGALLFAAGSGDSGVLSSSEIAQLSLPRHPLVVLAACGTFRGDAAHVSGMSSLAKSFLTAGARGVVGTLWEIDDDVSAPLFTRFHEALRAGVSPVHSLRDAQLDTLHSPDTRIAHPATWSPVELLGNV